MGDPNASIPTPEPAIYRPMFASFGRALGETSITFLSKTAVDSGIHDHLRLTRKAVAVARCRGLSKSDMINNSFLPKMEIDPDTYEVRANGELLTCEAAKELAMVQCYFLF